MNLQTRSFADFDRPYRRGLVLGLSLAELFIILVFLLLLATIGYSVIVEEELDRLEAANSQLQNDQLVLNSLQTVNAQMATDIGNAEARAEKAENDYKALVDELAAAENVNGNIIKDEKPQDLIVRQQNTIGYQKDTIGDLEAEIDKLKQGAAFGNAVSDTAIEFSVNPNDIPEMIANMVQVQSLIEDLESQLEAVKKERDKLKRDFSGMGEEKGQYPPCWYANDKKPDGRPRERPLYIFHVKTFDDGIFVKDIPAPTPEYTTQKRRLPFNRGGLNKHLDFDEFLKGFEALRKAGDNRMVQDYPCKFYVKVWNDNTSKDSYRHAVENVVEAVFFTYRIKEDPWPY